MDHQYRTTDVYIEKLSLNILYVCIMVPVGLEELM